VSASSPGLALHVRDVEESGAIGESRKLENKSGEPNAMPSAFSPAGDILAIYNYPVRIDFVGFDKPINGAGFNGAYATFSPDGRWLAYISSQSGAWQVYIRSFSDGGAAKPVSTLAGSLEERWKPTGELYYRNGRRWFSTHVSTNPEPKFDPPHQVFDTEFIDTPGVSYDVSPDGQRLLVVKRTHPIPTSQIHIIANWPSALPQAARHDLGSN
jgi:hypothetical protein